MPRFYEHWRTQKPPPEKAGFDCASCFMLKPKGLTRDLGPFKAALKCCTFQPVLPSFTLGALLSLETVSKSVLTRYLKRCRLTPLGAFPLQKITSVCETGKHAADGCAFLSSDSGQGSSGGACTIRDFRPSTCEGYVCRSDQGAAGLKEWMKWEKDIAVFESTLSHLTGFELGYTLMDIEHEFGSFDEACEFYLRAYETALLLKPEDAL